jgi:biopolymer transport protein ExbB
MFINGTDARATTPCYVWPTTTDRIQGQVPFYGNSGNQPMPTETSTSHQPRNLQWYGKRACTGLALSVAVALCAGTVHAQTAAPSATTEPAPAAQPVTPPAQQPGERLPAQAQTTTPAPVQAQAPVEQPAPVAPPAAQPEAPAAQPETPAQNNAAPVPAPPAAEGQVPEQTQQVTPPAAEPQALEPSVEPVERADIPHNLSPWGMFMAADWVVKGVMLGLAFASLITWTVWVAKSLELATARVRARKTLKVIRHAKTLAEATGAVENKGGPAVLMLRMASHELQLSEAVIEHTDGGGIKERVSSALGRVESHAGRRMSRGTGALATIGSTAPFVGLFGTVWGIMNSFISISESQTTNLAVVAPGIAEALLATAIGLVAAIPAVVIYNVFARSITAYRHLLADAAAGVERLVSRDLDFRRIPPGTTKPAVSLVGR